MSLPDTKFKGFVFDGLPCGLHDQESEINLDALPTDMSLLHKLVNEKEKTHIPVLIQLRISDENLIRRRAAQWLDPITNISYPGQQVLYSRQRRAQGWVDGQPNDQAFIEAGLKVPKEGQDGEDGDENQEDDEQEDEDHGDSEKTQVEDELNLDLDAVSPPESAVRKEAKKDPFLLKNKSTWTILSEQILNRYVFLLYFIPCYF